MKTIFNLFLILALAGFATRAQAQNTGDIRNSYNNDLPWTSEPEGVTPGPPAPPIEYSGIADARDIQDYSDIEQSMPPADTMPPATTWVVFHGRNPAGFRGGDSAPAGGFHGSYSPPAGGFHGGGSHGGTPPPGDGRH